MDFMTIFLTYYFLNALYLVMIMSQRPLKFPMLVKVIVYLFAPLALPFLLYGYTEQDT